MPASQGTQQRRLQRSTNARIGGVCAGIAEAYGHDVDMVRIVAGVLCLVTFGGAALVYLVLWLVLPERERPFGTVDVSPAQVSSETYGAVASSAGSMAQSRPVVYLGLVAGLAALVVVMAFVLAQNSPFRAPQFWPLAFMAAGIARMVIPSRTGRRAMPFVVGMLLFLLGLVLLGDSLGFIHLFRRAWIFEGMPLLLICGGLVALGFAINEPVLLFIAAGVFGVFCLVGVVFYAAPGPVSISASPWGAFGALPWKLV